MTTYWQWFEIAQVARKHLLGDYKDGVERVAALAAVNEPTRHLAIDAMERAFESMRISLNPRWDGSIA